VLFDEKKNKGRKSRYTVPLTKNLCENNDNAKVVNKIEDKW
jgi:hypothetical protein